VFYEDDTSTAPNDTGHFSSGLKERTEINGQEQACVFVGKVERSSTLTEKLKRNNSLTADFNVCLIKSIPQSSPPKDSREQKMQKTHSSLEGFIQHVHKIICARLK